MAEALPAQESDNRMQPWLKTMRRRLSVNGRQDTKVTITVAVYRDTVWVSTFDEPFMADAILELTHIDGLIDTLAWAADEARRYPAGDAV
ncbi:MAG: hypothetical protein ACRDS0_06285 [Pseudonocardiaceae bacterium]